MCPNRWTHYNAKQIKLIFEKNEATEIIEFLNKPIKSIYEDYIKDIDIEGFQTLKDDLNNIKQKMIEEQEENVDDYIEKYKKITNNLLLIFKLKISRNKKDKIKLNKKKARKIEGLLITKIEDN